MARKHKIIKLILAPMGFLFFVIGWDINTVFANKFDRKTRLKSINKEKHDIEFVFLELKIEQIRA
jgi:hypothetical protein